MTSGELSGWVAEALRRCATRGIADPLTPADLAELGLCGRSDALRAIHAPESMAEMARARRLVRRTAEDPVGPGRPQATACAQHRRLRPADRLGTPGRAVPDRLPFELTAAQSRAIGGGLA